MYYMWQSSNHSTTPQWFYSTQNDWNFDQVICDSSRYNTSPLYRLLLLMSDVRCDRPLSIDRVTGWTQGSLGTKWPMTGNIHWDKEQTVNTTLLWGCLVKLPTAVQLFQSPTTAAIHIFFYSNGTIILCKIMTGGTNWCFFAIFFLPWSYSRLTPFSHTAKTDQLSRLKRRKLSDTQTQNVSSVVPSTFQRYRTCQSHAEYSRLIVDAEHISECGETRNWQFIHKLWLNLCMFDCYMKYKPSWRAVCKEMEQETMRMTHLKYSYESM